jgi:hypothetical protein
MNVRRFAATSTLLAVVGVACYQAGTAAPAADTVPKESFAARRAEAKLRLAELALEKAQAMNRRVPGTLAGSTISQFTDDVELARQQLKNAKREGGADPFQSALDRAEMAVRSAENKYRKVREADERSPGVLQPVDLERWQLAAEVARLQLEQGRSLANADPQAKLQWQLEMLGDELSQIKQQTYLLGQNRLGQF